MNATKIDYLTHSWNPVAMRCTRVSPGCDHCWHLRMCHRHAANPALSHDMRTAKAGGLPVLIEKELTAPLRLCKPARIGVQFMGDLFHEQVPVEWIDRVFTVMGTAKQHRFFVLTKRPKWMFEWCTTLIKEPDQWPLPNVMLGISAEDQLRLEERVTELLRCPGAGRWLSLEPLLSGMDLGKSGALGCDCETDERCSGQCAFYRNAVDKNKGRIDWVVVGAETGSGARPMKLEWARSIRDQCADAGVPFWMKAVSEGPVPDDLNVRELPR